MSNSNQFDAIVIGSGIGGLTVAALLSKLNQKKVLILEQHYVVGGYTHEFARKNKFNWDVGLHYVGEMGKGDLGRKIFDYLSDGNLKWNKMPEPFEQFVYPDFSFGQSCDPTQFKADLIEKFPQEKRGIENYFSDIDILAKTQVIPVVLRTAIAFFYPRLRNINRLTIKEYLDRHFQAPQLKALLASIWGTYGLPPAQGSFTIHATIASHFLKGGYYPVGGALEIAKNILPLIEKNGGKALTQKQVTEIIIEDGIAKGVKVQKAHKPDAAIEEYYAPIVISDAGAFNTYTKLIPADNDLVANYREEIKRFPKGNSALTLFLGLKESPAKLGFKGENHWIYSAYDHDRAFQKQSAAPDKAIDYCYMSFASLKDTTQTAHTAQILLFVDYEFFSKWQEQNWRHREEEYYRLKEAIAQNILNFVESRYPGFKDLVEYYELSTPLTFAYFDASDRGAIYGIPCVPERVGKKWLSAKTPIENLYLTGMDVVPSGIMGATIGGITTAGAIDGIFGFYKIMSAIFKDSAAHNDNLETNL
ncbi:MAG: NAD(P)/FAD-dependent oxidoreductase [Hydrococcus sp. RU_2_2]|nr:NAD(P)/FAD-dependent oxidoreductase [Hydrococcus sp. RU_2_2]